MRECYGRPGAASRPELTNRASGTHKVTEREHGGVEAGDNRQICGADLEAPPIGLTGNI